VRLQGKGWEAEAGMEMTEEKAAAEGIIDCRQPKVGG